MTQNDLIRYSTVDGISQFSLRKINGQVWLTQLDMADLYQSSKQNISKHIKSVIAEGELVEGAVVNSKLTAGSDGKEYLTRHYALPMILATQVEYFVRLLSVLLKFFSILIYFTYGY